MATPKTPERRRLAASLAACFVLSGTACLASAAPPTAACKAVSYEGSHYVLLDDLVGFLGGHWEFTRLARGLRITIGDKRCEFFNGGDRFKDVTGKEHALQRPVLVIRGKHYVPLDECADLIGYKVEQQPQLRILSDGRVSKVRIVKVDAGLPRFRVQQLEAVHECLVTTRGLPAYRSRHSKADAAKVEEGSTLLVRRRLLLNDVPYAIVSESNRTFRSYLVRTADLKAAAKPAVIDRTDWARAISWFHAAADQEVALRAGPRDHLTKAVALTIDLCWSLRKCEQEFFDRLVTRAEQSGEDVYPVMFISGRWAQQHPWDLRSLLEMDRHPRVHVEWGLHSWAHPKSGRFMNEFSQEQVQSDVLQLETELLRQGVIPSVYYRFPGLIHDRKRLKAILEMDLFPIDCDSWMALIRESRPEPFYHPVRSGSIILIHGNGNEPKGIPLIDAWLREHRDWKLAPLHRFIRLQAASKPRGSN